MFELFFKDAESLNAVAEALRKNGYEYSTFVLWQSPGKEKVDGFSIRIEGRFD